MPLSILLLASVLDHGELLACVLVVCAQFQLVIGHHLDASLGVTVRVLVHVHVLAVDGDLLTSTDAVQAHVTQLHGVGRERELLGKRSDNDEVASNKFWLEVYGGY